MESKARYVVITGAGASRELGSERELILMAGWAEVLQKDLEAAESGLARWTGLAAGNPSGEDFEQALGRLGQYETAFPLMDEFRDLGKAHWGAHLDDAVIQWIDRQKSRLTRVREVLNITLFREFGRNALDAKKASDAYRILLDLLEAPSKNPIVFATTNYDQAIELALEDLGLDLNDGFTTSRYQCPVLRPEKIIDWSTNHHAKIPVLHLHGAVGWYLDEGQVTRQHPDQAYNPTLGTPLFMAPDPLKDPFSNRHMALIWEEFKVALSEATHVLIIGHSLNDHALVEAVRDKSHNTKVGVTNYRPGSDGSSSQIDEIMNDDFFPFSEVVEIPLAFGPRMGFPAGFEEWLHA